MKQCCKRPRVQITQRITLITWGLRLTTTSTREQEKFYGLSRTRINVIRIYIIVLFPVKRFYRISAGWSLVFIYWILLICSQIFSLIMGQSVFICFVLSWRLAATCIIAMLSQIIRLVLSFQTSILKQYHNPNDLTCGGSRSSIFRFSWGSWNGWLVFVCKDITISPNFYFFIDKRKIH